MGKGRYEPFYPPYKQEGHDVIRIFVLFRPSLYFYHFF